MTPHYPELRQVLREERGVMESMLRLLEEEQSLILSMDADAVENNAEVRESAGERLAEATGACRASIARLAQELALPEGVTLSSVIAMLPEDEREELEQLQQKIFSLSGALDGVLATNRRMLEGSMGLVERTMTFFNRMLSGCGVYGLEGRLVESAAAGAIVRRKA